MIFALMLATAVAQAAPDVAPTSSPSTVAATVRTEDDFQFGVDTMATVMAKLGKPNSRQTGADGVTTIMYFSTHAHVKGASFIPLVGLFAGGVKAHTMSKIFVFGTDGLLKSYSSGDTNQNCGVSPFGAGCH